VMHGTLTGRTAAMVFLGLVLGGEAAAQITDPGTAAAPSAYVPLTREERLDLYFRSMFGPMAWVRSGISAGWGQLRDRPKEWNEGARGFGLRYGSATAERITRGTITAGAAALLHEDNRYFHPAATDKGARLKYALASTFLARKDDGTRRFSFSRIGGMGAAALISRTWQPESTSSMRSAGVNFGVMLGAAAGFNVAREFLPGKLKTLFKWED